MCTFVSDTVHCQIKRDHLEGGCKCITNNSKASILKVVVRQIVVRKVFIVTHYFERNHFCAIHFHVVVVHLKDALVSVLNHVLFETHVLVDIFVAAEVKTLGFIEQFKLAFSECGLLEFKSIFVFVYFYSLSNHCWAVVILTPTP